MGDHDEDDNFFKCIQKATEQLSDPVKRRHFDSVDEAADVEPPSKKESQKGDFFKLWNPVFESEARFSKVQPVPMLGNENSTKSEVDDFYNFWYNFDSWRTFEYLDEDVPDDNENRDQKRHIEKKNANARRKRKAEDTARLHRVIDDCMALDQRLKKFRQEARAGKDKKRLEKEAEAKRVQEEKEKARLEEQQRQKAAEDAVKAEREQNKKSKEAAKNAAKKNKRVVKASAKDVNYFAEGGDPSADQVNSVLGDVDLIAGTISTDDLATLTERLTLAGKDASAVKDAYSEATKKLIDAGTIKKEQVRFFG